jgi:Lon protease-like protein
LGAARLGMKRSAMSTFEDLSYSLEEFSGRVRVFPLPNLVLFPHVMQPLHIFEPRYRDLLEDALAGDRLIAMAVLEPGWADDYEGRPPLYPIACLGRITTHHRLADGTYNVLVLCVQRVRLVRELEPSRDFREAEVELCADCCPPQPFAAQKTLHRRLREAFLKILPLMPEAQEQMDQLLSADVALGVLTDVISYMLDIDLHDKEALLAQVDVRRRAELLLKHLSAAVADHQSELSGAILFPPEFSVN